MKRVITYGTFDHLHFGHINLLKHAKELGDFLIVGVTTENFDINRGKLSVQQSLIERIEAVKATGLADLVIPEEYVGQKVDDITKYSVDIFAIGSDWKGEFDYLKDLCEVIYLERTKGISSTEIRKKNQINFGIIGYTPMVKKFIKEINFINELDLKGIYLTNNIKLPENIKIYSNIDKFYKDVDAVYIISDPLNRYFYVKEALKRKKHVLCESPITLSKNNTEELLELAKRNNCILFEGIKTAYAVAFNRLKSLIKSECIGKIISIEATCTSLKKDLQNEWGSFESWGSIGLLPVLSILGTDYKKKDIIIYKNNNKDLFTCINFIYDHSIASIKVAKGVKSEGHLIISGTEGFVYVPSPWWKTEYFELRFENPNENRRYYYKLDGEGIRYELSAFVNAINQSPKNMYIDKSVTLEISNLMEEVLNTKNHHYYL